MTITCAPFDDDDDPAAAGPAAGPVADPVGGRIPGLRGSQRDRVVAVEPVLREVLASYPILKLSARQRDEATFDLPDAEAVTAHRQSTVKSRRAMVRPSTVDGLWCAAQVEFEQQHGSLTAEMISARSSDFHPQVDPVPVTPLPRCLPIPPEILLEQLIQAVPGEESGVQVMSHLIAVDKLRSWLTAMNHVLLARLAEPGVAGDPWPMARQLLRESPPVNDPLDEDVDSQAMLTERDELLAGVALDLAATQVSAVQHVAPSTAARAVGEAMDIVFGLPLTMRALFNGRIDARRAKILAERTQRLTPEQRLDLEARLLPLAGDRTPRQWQLLIDAAVIDLDPADAERRRRDAVAHRRVEHEALPDGMGKILAVLPAEQAQLAWDLFRTVGDQLAAGDDRYAAQRRADILATIIEQLAAGRSVSIADLLADPGLTRHEDCCRNTTDHADDTDSASSTDGAGGGGCGGSDDASGSDDVDGDRGVEGNGDTGWRLPTRHGRRTHLTVTMTLDALAGLAGHPAMLAGHGVITADHARALASTATSVNLLITDHTGTGIGASNHTTISQRHRYRPGQATRDQVTTLRPVCVFPGCHQQAAQADLDHREPFNHNDPHTGGVTDPGNLYPACRHHHRLRTFGGWSYRPGPPGTGTLVFTSPLGIESTTILDGTLLPAGLRPPEPPDPPPPF